VTAHQETLGRFTGPAQKAARASSPAVDITSSYRKWRVDFPALRKAQITPPRLSKCPGDLAKKRAFFRGFPLVLPLLSHCGSVVGRSSRARQLSLYFRTVANAM